MSDEWILGRSLRHRKYVKTTPEVQEQATPSLEIPTEPEPRFLTTDGDLKPITEDTIGEIEAIVEAHLRGVSPEGYEPLVETDDGERIILTRESLATLIDSVRRQAERRAVQDPVAAEPPGWQTNAGIPPVGEEEPQPVKQPDEYVPWFDTVDGDLPPVMDEDEEAPAGGEYELEDSPVFEDEPASTDDVIEAEWVVSFDETGNALSPAAAKTELPKTDWLAAHRIDGSEKPLDDGDVDALEDGLVVADKKPKSSRRTLVLAGIVVVALIGAGLMAVLGVFPRRGGEPVVDESATMTAQAELVAAAVTPTITLTPEPTMTPTPSMPSGTAGQRTGKLAFASNRDGDFDIFVLDFSAGSVRQLTQLESADRSPEWSPDGKFIVFVSDRDGSDNLYLMTDTGTGIVQLTSSPDDDHTPAWSPDGKRIIFSRETITGADIYAFDVTCIEEPLLCEEQKYIVTSGRYDQTPNWSPDNSSMVYATSDFPGLPSAIAIHTFVDSESTMFNGAGGTDFEPAWSPDGRFIVFTSNRDEGNDIWIISSNGENAYQLTGAGGEDIQPTWSPDGAYIIFAADRGPGGDFELYLLTASCVLDGVDTCEQTLGALTDNLADDLDPDWSP